MPDREMIKTETEMMPESNVDLENTMPLPELKKVYISLHRSYCRQMPDKFEEGKVYNIMTVPRGTMLNGQDIGGGKINPRYMNVSKFNPDYMTATYYMGQDQNLQIKLSLPSGMFTKVDVEELKGAIDAQKERYHEQQKAQEKQAEAGQNRQAHQQKEKGEEIE